MQFNIILSIFKRYIRTYLNVITTYVCTYKLQVTTYSYKYNIHTNFSFLSIEVIRVKYVEMVNVLTHGGSSIGETARETCSLIFAIFQGALQSMINLMKGVPVWTTSEVPVQYPVESELLLERLLSPSIV